MSHTHRVRTISLRGKPDSVTVECSCGKTEIFAVWWTQPPKGWSKRQWPKLLQVMKLFLAIR